MKPIDPSQRSRQDIDGKINTAATRGLFTVKSTYEVPSNPNWGWQSKLTELPDGTLVLQMTNIAPWGEEGRAVRMIFSRIR